MNYQIENINTRLKTKSVQYDQNCRPVDPGVYQQFNEERKGRAVYDFWEKGEPNSQGWLGVIDDNGETVIEGEFKAYTHTGSYSGLMEVCKSIAMENQNLTEFYCIYLNSPDNTPKADLKTKIIFR